VRAVRERYDTHMAFLRIMVSRYLEEREGVANILCFASVRNDVSVVNDQ